MNPTLYLLSQATLLPKVTGYVLLFATLACRMLYFFTVILDILNNNLGTNPLHFTHIKLICVEMRRLFLSV